jgi:4-amino-4-deoxy-L-arabinose transferase-like glycosyltransferase
MRIRPILIALFSLVAAAHVLLLFVVIPHFSERLMSSYNQDRATDGYDYLAANLVAGNGYRFYPDTAPTLMREPGYPLLLAGLLYLFRNTDISAQVLNLFLAFATAFLIARCVRKLSDDTWVIVAAALLFLLHPGVLIAESRQGVETLFGFLITLYMLTLLKAIETNRITSYLMSGLVLGAAVLVRSVPILFPAFLLAYLLITQRRAIPARTTIRNIAVMTLAMLVVLSPWIARNYTLTKKIIPTASVLGVSAHAGYYIHTHQSEGKPFWVLDRDAAKERSQIATELGYRFVDGYYQTFYRTGDEIAFSKILFARVMSEYKQSPSLLISCIAENLFNFWFTGKTSVATALNILVQLPYVLLGSIGLIIGIRRGYASIVLPVALFIAYVIAVYAPILAQARYSISLIPLMTVLGAAALVAARKAKRKTSINTGAMAACDEDRQVTAF